MKNNHFFWQGHQAEEAVKYYWSQQGYSVWHHRFRQFGAEIDLIVRKEQNTLVFCEVKQRRKLRQALVALSSGQKQRLREHAEIFLMHHPGFWQEIRFDFIAVDAHLRIHHLMNVID